MKKSISLLLILALCFSLTIPAMAVYPETSEEARKNREVDINWNNTPEEYEILVNESYTLQEIDWVFGGLREPPTMGEVESEKTYDDIYYIGKDTKIIIKNTDPTDDSHIWLSLHLYEKIEDGVYVCVSPSVGQKYTFRQGGAFTVTAIDDSGYEREDDDPYILEKVYSGESITITGEQLGVGKDDTKEYIYLLRICQSYKSNEEHYWYFTWTFKVDDAYVADKIAADFPDGYTSDHSSNPFTDVPTGSYYHDAVLWALENSVTAGTSDTTFGPDVTCTRSQVVTFLWRAKGCPEPETKENPFKDVKTDDYFYKAVLWAVENNITVGTSDTTFAPLQTCTSAEVITFLWRANGKPAAETASTEYYAEPVAWANANGLLSGTAVEFAPNNQSPRSDIVTYLYRDAMNQESA